VAKGQIELAKRSNAIAKELAKDVKLLGKMKKKEPASFSLGKQPDGDDEQCDVASTHAQVHDAIASPGAGPRSAGREEQPGKRAAGKRRRGGGATRNQDEAPLSDVLPKASRRKQAKATAKATTKATAKKAASKSDGKLSSANWTAVTDRGDSERVFQVGRETQQCELDFPNLYMDFPKIFFNVLSLLPTQAQYRVSTACWGTYVVPEEAVWHVNAQGQLIHIKESAPPPSPINVETNVEGESIPGAIARAGTKAKAKSRARAGIKAKAKVKPTTPSSLDSRDDDLIEATQY